jgi:hypothetical protein
VNSHRLASVLLGILGIYLIGQTITEVATVVFYATLDSSDETLAEIHRNQVVISIFWAIFKFGFGVTLLVFRSRLGLFVARTAANESNQVLESSGVQSALFAVIGLYFGVKGATTLLGGFVQIPEGDGLSYLWPQYASSMAEVVFGLSVFFGASGLAGLWHVARQASRHRATGPAA